MSFGSPMCQADAARRASSSRHALGGDDSISIAGFAGATAIGDALTLTDQARGGADLVSASARGEADAAGDAEALSGHAHGGDDTVLAAEMYGDGKLLEGFAHGGNDLLIGGADVASAVPFSGPNMMDGDGLQLLGHAQAGKDPASAASRIWSATSRPPLTAR